MAMQNKLDLEQRLRSEVESSLKNELQVRAQFEEDALRAMESRELVE